MPGSHFHILIKFLSVGWTCDTGIKTCCNSSPIAHAIEIPAHVLWNFKEIRRRDYVAQARALGKLNPQAIVNLTPRSGEANNKNSSFTFGWVSRKLQDFLSFILSLFWAAKTSTQSSENLCRSYTDLFCFSTIQISTTEKLTRFPLPDFSFSFSFLPLPEFSF